MKRPLYAKFYVWSGLNTYYAFTTAHDLYLTYNDFVSINDTRHNCSPELTETIETIREEYNRVFELLPGGIYQIDEFEKRAIEILNGGE